MNKEQQPSINVLFLAAGKGERIKSVTEKNGAGFPKGLLEIHDLPIIERLLTQLDEIEKITPEIISNTALVTNEESLPYYSEYIAKNHPQIQVYGNGIKKEDTRPGAIGDLVYMLKKLDWQKDNLLVLPSDTITNVSLLEVILFFIKNRNSINVVHDSKDIEKIRNQLGCVQVGSDGIITSFEEKPKEPKSTLTSVPIYLYTSEALNLITLYEKLAKEKNDRKLLDSPGSVLPWLISRTIIQTFSTEEYDDVGKPEILDRLRNSK